MKARCDEGVAPGNAQEREPEKNTNSGDPEDMFAQKMETENCWAPLAYGWRLAS